jgi:hypothetical protein
MNMPTMIPSGELQELLKKQILSYYSTDFIFNLLPNQRPRLPKKELIKRLTNEGGFTKNQATLLYYLDGGLPVSSKKLLKLIGVDSITSLVHLANHQFEELKIKWEITGWTYPRKKQHYQLKRINN